MQKLKINQISSLILFNFFVYISRFHCPKMKILFLYLKFHRTSSRKAFSISSILIFFGIYYEVFHHNFVFGLTSFLFEKNQASSDEYLWYFK